MKIATRKVSAFTLLLCVIGLNLSCAGWAGREVALETAYSARCQPEAAADADSFITSTKAMIPLLEVKLKSSPERRTLIPLLEAYWVSGYVDAAKEADGLSKFLRGEELARRWMFGSCAALEKALTEASIVERGGILTCDMKKQSDAILATLETCVPIEKAGAEDYLVILTWAELFAGVVEQDKNQIASLCRNLGVLSGMFDYTVKLERSAERIFEDPQRVCDRMRGVGHLSRAIIGRFVERRRIAGETRIDLTAMEDQARKLLGPEVWVDYALTRHSEDKITQRQAQLKLRRLQETPPDCRSAFCRVMTHVAKSFYEKRSEEDDGELPPEGDAANQ